VHINSHRLYLIESCGWEVKVCLVFSKHTVITGVLLWLYCGCLLVVVDAIMVA